MPMRFDKGRRRPGSPEPLPWNGIVPRGAPMRETQLLWRRRRLQMVARQARGD